jgi:hypothetical protein
MTTEMKQILYENYNNKYSDIFESKYSKKRRYDVNWDNALTILMFEEGPSKILELIVDSNGMCFEKILKNLEMRYHEKGFEKRIKSVFEAEQKKEMDAIRRGINYSDSIVSNIQILNKTLMARCIIDGLVELEHNQIYSGTQFVESLPMRISSLKKITLTDTLYTQGIKISKILEKTFRFIIPFYCGIIAFQRCKDNALLKSESQNDGNINYEECEAAFFSAARAKAEELARATLGQLVESFREFAGSLRQDDGKRQRVTEDGKALKAAIGRDYFCSLKTFNKIISLKAGGYFNGEIKEIESDIVGYINNIKHENGKEGDVFYLSEEFVLKVKQLLYYFIYNEDFEREMVLGQQISYDPIYPYVVRYTEKSENRDGYQINGFSIFYDADNGVKEVKILSDRKYQINEKYYCIPNVTMSNSRWWIEPFLINCRKYDDLLRDVRMKYDKKKSDSTNKNDDEDKNYADEEWADKN